MSDSSDPRRAGRRAGSSAAPVRHRHSRLGNAVGLMALLVAAAIGLWAVFGAVGPTAEAPTTLEVTPSPAASSAPSPTGSSSATPTPTATPRLPAGIPTGFPTPVSLPTPTDVPADKPTNDRPSGEPTGDQEKPLVDNPLYAQRLAAVDCSRTPRPIPTSDAAYRTYLDAVFGCLERLYRPALREAGFTLTRPYLVFFDDRIQTPCGTSPTELSVFYCSANETVYATRRGLDDYATMRLGLYYVIFHEYAHHVQERAGILDAARFRHEEWPQISRRIELQAECLMGESLRAVRSTGLTAADRAELRAWRERVPDDQHGSSASQLLWIDRGLAAGGDLSRCSTWESPLDEVS